MTPTEFDFTVTMPGDERLVDAVRQLTAHAAGYAQLPPKAGEELARHVERETQTAIAASSVDRTRIRYRFTADPDVLVVVFSYDVAGAVPRPHSRANGAVSVEWSTEGTRQVCRISQRLPKPDA